MKRFVIGDIHGGFKALVQVLERAGFDREHDELISLGDVCDGWPQVRECVDFLSNLPHCRFVLGNHDAWFKDYIKTRNAPPIWTSQGGAATLESYKAGVPKKHKEFFLKAPTYIEDKGDLFVHGGFDYRKPMIAQRDDYLMWDRALIQVALRLTAMRQTVKFGVYERVFVGHTTLTNYGLTEPTLMAGTLWGLDTGGGWEGKLSVLDRDTGEFWQSDKVADLYPDAVGRGRA